MLELHNVSKSYAGKKALQNINLQIPQGEIIGLFGENSAGKTTLMKCILGFLRYNGKITLDGQPITHNNIARISFYKVLLGILEPHETVFLSTHLIEEVSDFIGRAILIHKGEIVDDVSVMELEEEGKDLVAYIKETYHYRSDRVGKALEELTEEE